MDNRIRLLGIVPYEGMKTLLLRVAAEYPQVDLDVFVGNMEEGVEIARSNFHNQYGAVISRGGTGRCPSLWWRSRSPSTTSCML